MPILTGKSGPIHYTEAGAGAPVLLVHSGGFTSSQWRGMAEALKRRWRVLAIDLHGCESTAPWHGSAPMTLSDEGALVRQLAAATGGGVHLAGHSYGGAVALRAVLDDPAGFASVTLMEPIPFNLLRHAGEHALYTELLGELEAFVGTASAGDDAKAMGRFVNYWNANGAMWEGLPAEVRAQLTARVMGMLHQCLALKFDATRLEDCRRVPVPTFLISGGATIAPMRRLVELLADRIPGSRHVVIPGLRHMAPATHPVPVAEALEAFLRERTER